jgi:tryptophan halogenase
VGPELAEGISSCEIGHRSPGFANWNGKNWIKRLDRAVTRVVIVGGGTAGWLSACRMAASIDRQSCSPLEVTLIESPDIPTIGVGEGTWPTMRGTLERIGITETEFLLKCDASFKQGSRFDGWTTGEAGDSYYHPFAPPLPSQPRDLVAAWRDYASDLPFAAAVSPQPAVCADDLAPRQRAMPDYAGALNYAYHFDAGRFAELLKSHGTRSLGIRHIADHVTGVERTDTGDIGSVRTRDSGDVEGGLFIDCTGHAALLIGGEYGVPFTDRSGELFNDRALAVQIPVPEQSAIASQTVGTAHRAGWIWDTGLASRRGVGCVYSSAHLSDADAEAVLRDYLAENAAFAAADQLNFRRLSFRSGHRERFWEANCLAIGLSAGFLEPLEASAIVLIELSLDALLDNFPATREAMDLHASRFNRLFSYRWDRIVDFLKLHYVLSKRDEPYWRDNREAMSISPRLQELLSVWKHQPPSDYDLPAANEVFPAASYQYVLYGMGHVAPANAPVKASGAEKALAGIHQVQERARALASALPANRAYLDALRSSCDPGADILLERS